jgi:hypothetical protein
LHRRQVHLTLTPERLEVLNRRAEQGGRSPAELARDLVIGALRSLYLPS